MNVRFALIALVLLLGSSAFAQGVPLILPGCHNAKGRMVPHVVEHESIPTYAAAGWHPQVGPIILLNPAIAAKFSVLFNMYAYLHECGHHRLGHVTPYMDPHRAIHGIQQAKELDADCYAVAKGIELGYIKNTNHLKEIGSQMIDWPEDPEHPSGEVRFRHMLTCAQQSIQRPQAVTR